MFVQLNRVQQNVNARSLFYLSMQPYMGERACESFNQHMLLGKIYRHRQNRSRIMQSAGESGVFHHGWYNYDFFLLKSNEREREK